MNISITPELEKRIAEKVAAGAFTTASEVICEGLRLYFEAEDRKMKRTQLQKDIQAGLDQLDRGDEIPGEQVFKELSQCFSNPPKYPQ